ncbi:MAG: nucleotidyltransferase family protein [Phycisphaerae bacterium]|nr:nucleotidyltransferase family protein [Phycisphaerae bacterium]
MDSTLPIQLPTALIAAFCRSNGIARLSLFGSVLREDFGPESDVDVLVEFLPGRTPTLFSIAEMEASLSELIGRKVDLRTPAELSKYFRDEVVASARLLHAA